MATMTSPIPMTMPPPTPRTMTSPTNDNFSSNARIDVLERYSRFYDKSEFQKWCQSSQVKYTEGFRDLILQINPFYIPCVYKKMFETCVTGNLRMAEGDGPADKDSDATKHSDPHSARKGSYSAPSTPRPGQQGDITNQNTSLYIGTTNNNNCKTQPFIKELCGWEMCGRGHVGTGYQKITAEEERDVGRRHTKTTHYRVLSPKTFSHPFKNIRHSHGTNCGYGAAHAPSKTRKVSRDRYEDFNNASSVSSSSSNVSSNVCTSMSTKKQYRRFKHHKSSTSYIEQYREDVTYPKLRGNMEQTTPTPVDVFICSCGSHTCPRSVTSSSVIQRWYPNQSQSRDHVATCEKTPCANSGVPAPKRTPILKKRPMAKPAAAPPYIVTNKPDESQKLKGHQRMEFFANSLTVTKFNPKRVGFPLSRTVASSSTSHISGNNAHCNSGNVAGTASDTSACLLKDSNTAELLARLCSFRDSTLLYPSDLPDSI